MMQTKAKNVSNSIALLLYFAENECQYSDLINWLARNLESGETLDAGQHLGHLWYLDVRNKNGKLILGFTISLKTGKIIWANDASEKSNGGSCFCHDFRWRKICKEKYPELTLGNEYRNPGIESNPYSYMMNDYCEKGR